MPARVLSFDTQLAPSPWFCEISLAPCHSTVPRGMASFVNASVITGGYRHTLNVLFAILDWQPFTAFHAAESTPTTALENSSSASKPRNLTALANFVLSG